MHVSLMLCIFATFIRYSFEFSPFDILSSLISPFYEQCDSRWVIRNVIGLEADLDTHVFGQDLAIDVILAALQSHITKTCHKKPLVLNFHGWPGGGKGYVAEFIIKHWFKRGEKSRFVKQYKAKLDFPLASEVYNYQRRLQKELEDTIYMCPRAMFVFDEVDKYPPHVLDGLKPYLDYHSNIKGYDFREAIFIFITNTGERLITDITLQKWQEGVHRDQLKLRDFEEALKLTSFNDKGGFFQSDLIRHHLIDHVIPFLPLERVHVESCIRAEFFLKGDFNHQLLDLATKEIIQDMTFGPAGFDLYSVHGCKHIHEMVSIIIERDKRHSRRKNKEEF